MKILLTGVSSFTGCWFARALTDAGHEVVGTLTKPREAYSGVRAERLRLLDSVRLVPSVTFGSAEFLQLLEEGFDLLAQHAAEGTNYNSPAFDAHAALQKNTNGVEKILATFRGRGGRGVVLTGSIFEANEGKGTEPRRAFNPYGLSKTLTAEFFAYHAAVAGLSLGKFVIPNPFGPHEEPRFTSYLIRTWKEGGVPEVKTPDYVRDNVPIDLLAKCYVDFVARVGEGAQPVLRANPSHYAETQGAFALRFAAEIGRRLGRELPVRLAQQTDFSQPLARVNTEPAAQLVPGWNEAASWDAAAAYYRSAYGI